MIDFNHVWNTIPFPAFIINSEFKIIEGNSSAEQIIHTSRKQMFGKELGVFFGINSVVLETVKQVRQQNSSLSQYGVEISTIDRVSFECNLHINPLDKNNEKYLLIIQPNSFAQKINQSSTQRTTARSVTAMASMLAHEIRNPLAGISGAAQLLAMNANDDDVDGKILNLLDKTMESAITYNTMESQREKILWSYGLLYLGFATFVILSSILLGMLFAERLSRPVGRLAGAAQRLGAGDFDVKVIEEKGDDEIAMLSRVFNHMTKQVKRQRDDLIAANDYTERRRRLFDSVLSGVTAGVIGLSSDGNIGFINLAAQKLLNLNSDNHEGKSIQIAVPEFIDLFRLIQKNDNKTQQQEIKLTRAGAIEILLVRISARISENELVEGYVITFDDVTNLVSAQRLAAWGDVARRIAHEIKNPLTPIQLSAERLKRKYSPIVGTEDSNLSQYCDVIIRQTNDLRRIVDEFSKFARMPEPIKRPTNVTKLLKDVILLFQVSSPKISIVFNNLYDDFNVSIDETMINQAFTNLIKNAGEAIESKLNSQPDLKFDPEIRITIDQIMNDLEITIEDNGIGLPNQGRSRLFEPYVTNRENGTGLGLSIVKKIIEEHNGSLELLDASPFSKTDSFGAKMRIVFPKEIIIEN